MQRTGLITKFAAALVTVLSAPLTYAATAPQDYGATPHAVVVHFGQIPPLGLPCGELDLFESPDFANYMSVDDYRAMSAAAIEHKRQSQLVADGRETIEALTQDLMFDGYQYHRLKDLGIDQPAIDEAEWTFLTGHYNWLVALARLSQLEQARNAQTRLYLDKAAPLFRIVATPQERERLLNSFHERLGCVHRARSEAFIKAISGETRLAELTVKVDDGSRAGAVDRATIASQLALVIAAHARYSWLAGEEMLQLQHYRELTMAHVSGMAARRLHPRLRELQAAAGAALGPEDAFPPDPQARRIRAEISNQRARIALGYLYMTDVKNELAYFKKLNVMSGLYGLSGFREAGNKFLTDVGASKDLRKGASFDTQDVSVAALSIVAAATEFIGGSFSTLVAGPIQDAFITRLKQPAEFLGYDLKTSAEKAFDDYRKAHATTLESIRFVETIIERHSGDTDAAFVHGKQLIAEVAGDRAGRRATGRVPIARFLDDDAFVAGTGGGIASILEPFAESPAEIARLHFHAARESLKGAARNGYLRIATDRGITVDNPDLDLTIDRLSETPTDAELGLTEDSYLFTRAVVRSSAYVLSGPGRAQMLDTLWPSLSERFFYGATNRPSQNEWLQQLINCQSQFDQQLASLRAADYRPASVAGDATAARRHQWLLNHCASYIQAHVTYRGALTERMKLFKAAQAALPDNHHALEETRLAMLDKAQQIELYDLMTRAAYLELTHDALTVNYLAAAGQARALERLENQRRAALGIKEKIDLKETARLFRREARLSAATTTYQGLLRQAATDLTMAMAAGALANLTVNGAARNWDFLKLSASAGDIRRTFNSNLNPWSSFYQQNGLLELLQDGAVEATVTAVAQAATQGTVFKDDDVSGILSSAVTLARETRQARNDNYNRQQAADTAVVRERLAELVDMDGVLFGPYRDEANQLSELTRAAQSGDTERVQQLQTSILQAAKNAAINRDRARYKVLMEGLQDVMERKRVLDEDIEAAVTTGPVVATTAATLRDRYRAAPGDSSVADRLARLAQIRDLRETLTNGVPTVRDLETIASASDPLNLRPQLLTRSLDIELLRNGLKNARKKALASNDSAALASIDQAATAMDQHRIKLVNQTLAAFFQLNPEFRDAVEGVVQGGAAEGNPEYQGIYGDIDFTVLTRPGYADGERLKKTLETFFAERGTPLADGDTASSMDTETFVQPAGRFDAAREDRVSIAADTQIKMADATRFYSEGGGKWFLNNMLYSGKVLWGVMTSNSEWINVSRGEAHGLAVDMTRFMDYLTDPKYDPAKIATLDAQARREALDSAMKKTKYFIRLIDAYVISHADGNGLYNARIERVRGAKPASGEAASGEAASGKAASGEAASYHWQIFADVATLMDSGASTVFDQPGDRDIVEAMAKMKMKGDNPTPWDVLGSGPDADARALRMVERMRELAPAILASTAQRYHEEVQDTIRSGTEAERKAAFSDVNRSASTLRKVLEVDSFGSMPLMTPKAERDANGDYRTLSEDEHRQRIATAMREAGVLRQQISLHTRIRNKIAENFRDKVPVDADGNVILAEGEKMNADIEAFIAQELGPDRVDAFLEQSRLVDQMEEQYYAWLRYQFSLATQLSDEADGS